MSSSISLFQDRSRRVKECSTGLFKPRCSSFSSVTGLFSCVLSLKLGEIVTTIPTIGTSRARLPPPVRDCSKVWTGSPTTLLTNHLILVFN
ncbi:unnamed protein product [Brassica oleracea]